MSDPFLRFESGKIMVGGKDLYVKSANLSIAPSLEAERVYGGYDPATAGAKVEFVNFSPVNGIRGTLDISFLITAEDFKKDNITNNIQRMFDIKDGMDEYPIHNNLVGRYRFDNMYLKSFGFSLTPFQLIQANASYNIYGSVRKSTSLRTTKTKNDFVHALKSFGNLDASTGGSNFEITNLSYNIIVNRKEYNHIRDGEHTSINTTPDGVVPTRVSVENIEVEMSVEAHDIVANLNSHGSSQTYGQSLDTRENSSISAFLYSLQGEKIARFSCTGKIQNQSLSIGEGEYSKGQVSIKQIIK